MNITVDQKFFFRKSIFLINKNWPNYVKISNEPVLVKNIFALPAAPLQFFMEVFHVKSPLKNAEILNYSKRKLFRLINIIQTDTNMDLKYWYSCTLVFSCIWTPSNASSIHFSALHAILVRIKRSVAICL